MKDLKNIVESVAASAGRKNDVQEAVNQILGEDIKAGQTVAVVDDPIYGYSGAKGKVKGESRQGSGFVDVELENGTSMPMQSSLLVPV
jgi:hypothetical protein